MLSLLRSLYTGPHAASRSFSCFKAEGTSRQQHGGAAARLLHGSAAVCSSPTEASASWLDGPVAPLRQPSGDASAAGAAGRAAAKGSSSGGSSGSSSGDGASATAGSSRDAQTTSDGSVSVNDASCSTSRLLLMRDFIHQSLYHPTMGYFNSNAPPVGRIPEAINFKKLVGKAEYKVRASACRLTASCSALPA